MVLYLLFYIVALYAYLTTVKSKQKNVKFLFYYFVCSTIFVGISDMLGGYDRYIYAELFNDVTNNIDNGGNIFQSVIFQLYDKEIGYDFLNVAIGVITKNRYIFIFIVTVMIYTVLYRSFKQYVENYPFGVMLFLALMFFFTFTYLRQMLGVGIAWLSIKYIIQRRPWPFVGVMALAFLFHNSALIFFPMYFIPIRKFTPNTIITIMGLCLLIGLTPLPSAVFAAYGDVSDSGERVAGYVEDTSGFRIAYLIEACFFLFFILSKYRTIPNEPKRVVLLNMALAFCGILLFFIKSENGGRLGWYYLMGLFATLSYIASKCKKTAIHNVGLIVVCFFLFVRILVAWGIQLYPYKTFFTNGHREGDFIYEKYEYDQNYDKDKFYK